MAATLQCPQCGGENELPSGARVLSCRFCDAALYVDRSGLVSHYRLPRRLDRGEAAAALRRWMAGNDTVKDLDKKATGISLTPFAFPVWMFRLRTPGGERVMAQPAAATAEPALADLALPAGRLEVWRGGEEGVEAVAASVPLDTARGWLDQHAGGGAQGGHVTETALVEVPLWRAGYSFRGRGYRALVEASTGTVLSTVYPEKSESPYFLVAGLGLLLYGAEGLLISDFFFRAFAYTVTSVPLLGLAWWVTRRV